MKYLPWNWTAIGYANAMFTIIAIALVVIALKPLC